MRIKVICCVLCVVKVLLSQISYAQDIPVIVIAPGKTLQSLNTVGSTVTVIDAKQINEFIKFIRI